MKLEEYRNLKVAKELMGEDTDKTEFGRGFVYSLVLFAMHFDNEMARRIGGIQLLIRQGVIPEHLAEEAKKAGVFLMPGDTLEQNLASAIESWANGASDHLYEIVAPEQAPQEIKDMATQLRDLGLQLGHGFQRDLCTWENYLKLRKLTCDLAMMVDISFSVLVDEGDYK